MTDEINTKRIAPQDIEAEKSLLGAILISEESLPSLRQAFCGSGACHNPPPSSPCPGPGGGG